jgi:uncharacterized protein
MTHQNPPPWPQQPPQAQWPTQGQAQWPTQGQGQWPTQGQRQPGPPAGPPPYQQAYPAAPQWQAGQGLRPRASTNAAMWAHLGTLLTWLGGIILFAPLSLFCFVTPLIIRSQCSGDPFVRHHTTQSLNSCFTGLVIGVAGIVLGILVYLGSGLGPAILVILIVLALAIARAVYEIIGAVRASNGERYTFPTWIAFRFIRDDTL